VSFLEALLGGRRRRDTQPFSEPILDLDRLMKTARDRAAEYAVASPFPHAVIDDFVDRRTVAKIAGEFPRRDDPDAWLDYNGPDAAGKPLQHRKYHISEESHLGPTTQRVLYELKSARFLEILGTLTGIDDLIPDALNHGGGIHMNCRGALLKIHADFNRHPTWHLDRRLNLLLYLNEGWQDSYGGGLELWDAEMKQCCSRIAPIAGRCVIFSTSSTSYHGHPDPIDCPDHASRKSIALYYYTSRQRDDEGVVQSTLWQARPGTAD
jgi:hypothetical protein